MTQNSNGNGPGNGRQNKGDEDSALQARLAKLSHKLDARQGDLAAPDKGSDVSSGSLGAATNLGLQVLAEFVTAIVVAPIIGWQIDAWLSTTPIFFIIFLILGMVAGLVNVYRVAVRPTGPKRGTD